MSTLRVILSSHDSWSQEKAYVTGMETSNLILGYPKEKGITPLLSDEFHVAFGCQLVSLFKNVAGFGDTLQAPSIVDFLW